MLKAIIFDFDGVILESMDIKTRAFAELFAEYPEHVDNIVKLHLEYGGVSRFEKFKMIYRDFLKMPINDEELQRLGLRFSELVLEEVLRCPFVPGAYEFVERYSNNYSLFVASGTPEGELIAIVKSKNLSPFFRGVHGSPTTKATIIKRIIRENGLRPGEVVFIGDALSDYRASSETSVHFIGRVRSGTEELFPRHGVLALVKDFRDLSEQWRKLLEQIN
jgi:phosphoglycolate phosphatase